MVSIFTKQLHIQHLVGVKKIELFCPLGRLSRLNMQRLWTEKEVLRS
jgi:hypothetical protein